VSTYSASRQANTTGHPIDERLIGYIEVLYPGYRGTPVMTHPRYPARDMPRLLEVTPGGLPEPGLQVPRTINTATNTQAWGLHIARKRCHHPSQRQDNTTRGRIDSKSLSSQVKLAPHGTGSKNLLEHYPPQRPEHPRTNENTMEAPTDLSVWDPLVM
jgi:hypothetical protein